MLSSVEVLKVLKWIGELERRTISAELALPKLLLSWSLKTCFRFRESTIHGCHASIDVRVNGYNMLWFRLQAESRMQSNTDRSCLLIPFTSAPNTWKNRNQAFPHAGHADPLAIGAKKSVHFQLYRSTRLLPGHSTSSKCSHYIIRRLSKPEFCLWTTITIRVEMTPLMTESRSDYQHTSILTHSNSTTITIRQQTPDFVLQQPQKKLLLSIS